MPTANNEAHLLTIKHIQLLQSVAVIPASSHSLHEIKNVSQMDVSDGESILRLKYLEHKSKWNLKSYFWDLRATQETLESQRQRTIFAPKLPGV